ncbi:hypothetical protein [uncultured Corynebacterium sp.]|uniref:hypothetical protein n=1 Tax=uncultured Corynebacterium sp. TaxID=159447 RepID=UPI0025DE7D23|nr:hypothetical protein [uncultured Corynebacterium sp.]
MTSRPADVFRNWRTAAGGVFKGSSTLLAGLAAMTAGGQSPSQGLAISRDRVADAEPAADETTMLRWFFDWSWVHRRVENIRVLDNAQTRRHFSFDVELPVSPELRRRDSDGNLTHQVNVPLLFLRRGMLVNLDIRDTEGRAMPTISSSENLMITYRAVKQLADRVGMVELMAAMVAADRRREAEAGNPTTEATPAQYDYSQVVTDAVLSLINTHGVDRGHFNDRTVDRRQEDHRHQLFEALGEIVHCLCADHEPSGGESATVPVRLPKMKKTGTDPSYVLDTSPAVDLLARTILYAAEHPASSDPGALLDLELLCVLLSTVSYSYLLCIVADEKEVWTGTTSRRTVVKLACDVEPDDSRLNIFNPTRKVLIRYSQATARSTHLEFSPPENAVVQSITAPVVTHLVDPTDTDFPVETIPFHPGIHRINRHSDLDRDGFYRASQNRVHVEPPLDRADPVRTLRVSLTPEQRWQAGISSIVAAVVVVLCRFLWGDGVGGFPGNPFSGTVAVTITSVATSACSSPWRHCSPLFSVPCSSPPAATDCPGRSVGLPGARSGWPGLRRHCPRRDRLFDRPVQDRRSVLAVTETGAFDCHYLTDPAHREQLAGRARNAGTELSGASGTVTPRE